jgi:hypothetical protein
METKHTPGPWHAVDNKQFWEIRTSDWERSGEQIGDACASCFIDGHKDNPVAEANAHLMAAAPDLFAALTALMGDHGGSIGVSRTDERALAALAAIAKATGEKA